MTEQDRERWERLKTFIKPLKPMPYPLTNEEIDKLAAEKYPIEKGDCRTTRQMKNKARQSYIQKLRKQRDELNQQV